MKSVVSSCDWNVHLRPVADHERDPVLAEQRVHVLVEPARVPELEGVALLGRQPFERAREPLVVALEVRRSCQRIGPSFGEPSSGSMHA